jgi:exonuclease SbcC
MIYKKILFKINKINMRIRLKNFRCYEDNTFELGDSGVTLISAPSGYGKSTILNGIHFALFGVGNKVTSFGKTSCLVELEFDDIKITRTKRPNRLVVNDIYEDDVAQELINSKFGENFDVTGYISQNAMNSFIMMNPLEKLSFLERFAFKNINLNDIKSRCKANISKTHDDLIANESKLLMARKIIEEIKKPDESIKFPIKCKKTQIELAIKNENVRFKNCTTLIAKAQNTISKKEKELNSNHILNSIISTRTESIESINNKINHIDSQVESINLDYTDETKLEDHKQLLLTMLLQKEIFDLESRFNEDNLKLINMRAEEEAEYKVQLENINNELWQEFSSEELADTLESLSSTLNDIDKIENIRKDLIKCNVNPSKIEENELKLNLMKQDFELKTRLMSRLKLQKELYSCPSCNVKLRLVKNSLCLENNVDGDIDMDMSTITNQIKTLTSNIDSLTRTVENDKYKLKLKSELELSLSEIVNSYEELAERDNVNNDITYLKEYSMNQKNLEKKKKTIEYSIQNSSFSSSYNSFRNNVLSLEKKLNKLKSKNTSFVSSLFTESDLRSLIQLETETISLHKSLSSNKSELCKEKTKHENLISQCETEHIIKYQKVRSELEIENEVNILQEEIQSIEIKKEEHFQNLRLIDEWKRIQTDIETYNQWKERITKFESECDISRQKHAASTILKEKILEAESIALLNIIDTINTHVQIYLEAFFPDDPITISLQTFKETKKNTKPSINLAIEYKGMECDLNMLSGGELSRVILSYTLALGEIFNTPLLMLDESTASLDQSMTSCVFNGIKEHFNGKLVVIIAHQIVEGGFDRVIKLDRDNGIGNE